MKNIIYKYFHQLLAIKSAITKREQGIAFLIFSIFAAAFSYFQVITAMFHHLDTAFMMEVLTSIKESGTPTSHLAPSFGDALDTFNIGAETICKADLIPHEYGESILDTHAYFILYPLAALTWLFPPHIVLAVANGLGFASVIFILYWVIRRQGVPILGAIAFCMLVMAHPAWSHASLGDFYADRFFMPLGLLYVSLLYEAMIRLNDISRNWLLLVIAVGLLAASTTERGAVMIALFTIAVLVLYWKRITPCGAKIALTIFSMALLTYVFLYMRLIYVDHHRIQNLLSKLEAFSFSFEPIKALVLDARAHEFIAINVLLFGIFAIFDWRLALIAFAALLPNLFMSMGGAEKNSWATHYHSIYFPFLAFASAIGFGKLWVSLGTTKYRLILIGFLLALIPAIYNYSPGYRSGGAIKRLYDFYANLHPNEINWKNQLKQIAAAVPTGAKVTTVEKFMSVLYRGRTVYYYPVGIDTADYAVLNRVTQPDGSFYYEGVISYIGESTKAEICLTRRLKRIGYNLEQPRLLSGSIVVLERKNK